tara:strand:+ start:1065 stop:3971 length:2907 start_codon:yes stop_codon:yes gene_type:complete
MAVITIEGFFPVLTEESGGSVVEVEGYISPNQALENLKVEQEAQMLAELPPFDPNELPTLPTEGAVDTGQKTTTERAKEEIKQRFAPVVNPVLEVMNAVNAGIYGTAFDLAVSPYEIATGETVDRPTQVKNQTYMPDPEDAEFLDKGAFYATMGMGINSAARLAVNQFGKNMALNAGTRSGFNPTTGKPFSRVGGESKRAAITRDIASTSMSGETSIGLAMASAGQLAKEDRPKPFGVDVLQLPLEVAAGVVTATRPSTYLDVGTGYVRDAMRGYRDIPVDPNLIKNLLTAEEAAVLRQYEAKFGSDNVVQASKELRGAPVSVSPVEAKQALVTTAEDTVLSIAQKIDDPGIFTLQRSLAAEDPIFAGDVKEGIDFAQASLAKEFNDLMNPSTGEFNFDAFKNLMPKIQDDLLSQVDDRVAAAQDKLATINRIYESDPVSASKEFTKVFDEMLADITTQEQRLWTTINDTVLVPTDTLKQEVAKIVAESTKQTKLPVKEIEEILGRKVVRTSNGWRIVQGVGGKKPPRPAVSLLPEEAPLVLTQLRSNLSAMSRNANKATEPAFQYDQGVLIRMQQAVLDNLTRGADGVDPALREVYLAANAFTKKKHDALTRSTLIPVVRKAPEERKLGKLLGKGTKDQEDIAVAASELERVFNVAPVAPEAKSAALKNAEQYLLNKFSKEVNPEDLATYDLFMANHRDWIRKFPELGNIIKDARNKAKTQGVVIENALKAQEAKRLDEFATIAGANPDTVINTILNSANPSQTAARFKRLLGKNKVAVEEFKTAISNKIAAQSLSMVDKQVKGAGRQQAIATESFETVLNTLGPVTKQFLGKSELANLQRIHNYSATIARDLQAQATTGKSPAQLYTVALEFLGKLGALKAVSAITGSQSIVLSGVVSRGATEGVKRLSVDQTKAILKEAFKNEELMKILLSNNITQKQLQALQDPSKIRTGRVLFNAIVEKTTGE